VLGVIRCTIQETDEFLKVSTTYNCEILKGRELADIIEKADLNMILPMLPFTK
jgi:hypothetical protein